MAWLPLEQQARDDTSDRRSIAAKAHRPLGIFLAVGLALICSHALAAQQTAGGNVAAAAPQISAGQIWTFFFMLLGPIKLIGPFSRLTRDGDSRFIRQMAVRGTIFAGLVLLVAALVGVRMLDKFGMQPPVVAMAGGIVVFLTALRSLLDQVSGIPNMPRRPAQTQDLLQAFSPLAFPIIVTPAGIAAVIVFMALATDTGQELLIGELLLAILALDLCAMLFARVILRWGAMPLQVFGAVLGLVQLALGLHVILGALQALSVITYTGR
jgi:multiple antibiotic resistance protein